MLLDVDMTCNYTGEYRAVCIDGTQPQEDRKRAQQGFDGMAML